MELASNIIAAISVLVAGLTFVFDKIVARKQRTIEKLIELRTFYHDSIAGNKNKKEDDYYRKCVKFFGNVEELCSGAFTGYYSQSVIKKTGSRFITLLYNNYKEYLIAQRRAQFHNDDYYQNLENLVKKFDKKRGAKNV